MGLEVGEKKPLSMLEERSRLEERRSVMVANLLVKNSDGDAEFRCQRWRMRDYERELKID